MQLAGAAAEIFKKHDIHYANRNIPDSLIAYGRNEGFVLHVSYSEYWQIMRKICTIELTVQKWIDASASLRETCMESMIRWIGEDEGHEVFLEEYLFCMTLNLISSFMISRDVIDMTSTMANEFFQAMTGFMGWIGKANLTDVFGFLRWIDPQGIRCNTTRHLEQLLNVVKKIVKERI